MEGKVLHAFNNRDFINPKIFYLCKLSKPIVTLEQEKSNTVPNVLYFFFPTEYRSNVREIFLKCIIKLYLYIPSVTLRTVLTHSPKKPVSER